MDCSGSLERLYVNTTSSALKSSPSAQRQHYPGSKIPQVGEQGADYLPVAALTGGVGTGRGGRHYVLLLTGSSVRPVYTDFEHFLRMAYAAIHLNPTAQAPIKEPLAMVFKHNIERNN